VVNGESDHLFFSPFKGAVRYVDVVVVVVVVVYVDCMWKFLSFFFR